MACDCPGERYDEDDDHLNRAAPFETPRTDALTHHTRAREIPVLPQQPLDPTPAQQALTHDHLEPHEDAVLQLWQHARSSVDPPLAAAKPVKGGKPYPLGQCLELSQAVLRQLRLWLESGVVPGLPAGVADGCDRLRAFLTTGGQLRLVWGVLRGCYFQKCLPAWRLVCRCRQRYGRSGQAAGGNPPLCRQRSGGGHRIGAAPGGDATLAAHRHPAHRRRGATSPRSFRSGSG